MVRLRTGVLATTSMTDRARPLPKIQYWPAWCGYSLLELLIVCGLLAILLSLAVPTYTQYLARSHRSAAIEKLLAAAACQQRLFAREFGYDTRQCLPSDTGEFYTLRFEPAAQADLAAFTVVADPLGSQIRDPCGSLSLDDTGRRDISGPAEWSRKCWEGR